MPTLKELSYHPTTGLPSNALVGATGPLNDIILSCNTYNNVGDTFMIDRFNFARAELAPQTASTADAKRKVHGKRFVSTSEQYIEFEKFSTLNGIVRSISQRAMFPENTQCIAVSYPTGKVVSPGPENPFQCFATVLAAIMDMTQHRTATATGEYASAGFHVFNQVFAARTRIAIDPAKLHLCSNRDFFVNKKDKFPGASIRREGVRGTMTIYRTKTLIHVGLSGVKRTRAIYDFLEFLASTKSAHCPDTLPSKAAKKPTKKKVRWIPTVFKPADSEFFDEITLRTKHVK